MMRWRPSRPGMPPDREPLVPPPLAPGSASVMSEEGAEGTVSEALRLVAMREHTLLSLSELSQELTISLDLFSLADLVLFNLMGQLGTSRAAMWVVSEQGTGVPILVRSHGIGRQIARALGPVCTVKLLQHLAHDPGPVAGQTLDEVAGAAATRLIQRAEIALFAAVRARGEVLGLLALGPPIGGRSYGPLELPALQA